jgi:hypothetical protein
LWIDLDASDFLANAAPRDRHCEERSDEAIHLKFQLDCFGRLRLPAHEHLLFVIASPTQSGVAIQLKFRWMAASLCSSP